MPSEYHLEINEPDNDKCIAGAYESKTPFGSFHVGDTIEGVSLNLSDNERTVRITRVKHILWENSSLIKHKICLSTESIGKERN